MSIEPFPDAAARERIRTDLTANLCVEAGAGTGKTTVLVSRLVEILRTGHASVDEIAVITFTDAAAAELAGRVREALELARAKAGDPAQTARLVIALRDLPQGPYPDHPRVRGRDAGRAAGRGAHRSALRATRRGRCATRLRGGLRDLARRHPRR